MTFPSDLDEAWERLYKSGLVSRWEPAETKQEKASWVASKVVERRVYRLEELKPEEVTEFLQWLTGPGRTTRP